MKANYHLKNRRMEARQHDGTDDTALALVEWVKKNKGDAYAILRGDADLETYLGEASVVIKNGEGKISSVIRPNYWIIQYEPGFFYGCYPDIFKRLYKPLTEDNDQAVSQTS